MLVLFCKFPARFVRMIQKRLGTRCFSGSEIDFTFWELELAFHIYRVYQKKVDKSEIALCFAKRLNIRCFFIKIDCFGTYNLEQTEKIRNLKLQYPGGGGALSFTAI